jgi:hypothetical protein
MEERCGERSLPNLYGCMSLIADVRMCHSEPQAKNLVVLEDSSLRSE